MNVVIALAAGFLIGYFLQERRITRLKSCMEELRLTVKAQETAFEELLYEFSHRSATSPAASILGLMNVIVPRLTEHLSKLLNSLTAEQALQQKDTITEIHDIIHVDMKWCSTAAANLLNALRDTIRRFGHYQYPIDSQGRSVSK